MSTYQPSVRPTGTRPTVLKLQLRTDSNRISLPALFNNLQHPDADPNPDPLLAESFGRSLMIEGGAAVLASFLSATSTSSDADSGSSSAAAATAARIVPLVDLVVVTVAPVLIGPEGLSVPYPPGSSSSGSGEVSTFKFSTSSGAGTPSSPPVYFRPLCERGT